MTEFGQKQTPLEKMFMNCRMPFSTTCLAVVMFLATGCSDGGGYLLEVKPESATAAPAAHELVLPLEVDLRVAEEFVSIGYGLDKERRFHSTEFLTPRLRTAQAAQLVRLVKQYNNFDGERVASAVASLRGRVAGVEFGREGSPVLYLELPYWTNQREEAKGPGEKIAATENDHFVAELRTLFLDELKADEFSARGRRVRIWWD